LGFTGTGLAYPNTGRLAIAAIAGRMMVPKRSMCGIGLRVRRPASLAVRSPNHSATTPWLISWRMTATIRQPKKMTVCSSMCTEVASD
jgi:hypothetical protein